VIRRLLALLLVIGLLAGCATPSALWQRIQGKVAEPTPVPRTPSPVYNYGWQVLEQWEQEGTIVLSVTYPWPYYIVDGGAYTAQQWMLDFQETLRWALQGMPDIGNGKVGDAVPYLALTCCATGEDGTYLDAGMVFYPYEIKEVLRLISQYSIDSPEKYFMLTMDIPSLYPYISPQRREFTPWFSNISEMAQVIQRLETAEDVAKYQTERTNFYNAVTKYEELQKEGTGIHASTEGG